MSEAFIQLRVNQLKAMDEFVHSINNEELMEDWLSCGVPDEASEEDYSYIACDEELGADLGSYSQLQQQSNLKRCLANNQAKVNVDGSSQPSKLSSRLKRIDGTVATNIDHTTLDKYKFCISIMSSL